MFAGATLLAFTGTMKAVGIFAVGTFPWPVEIASSILLLVYTVWLTVAIRRLEKSSQRETAR